MKKKAINIKKETIKDIKIETNPIKRPPDVEIPPDPNKPVEK